MNFSQGHSGTKVQCESCLFSLGKNNQNSQKKGRNFVFACDPSDHSQESPGPPGPKSQKGLKKSLLGGSAKGPRKYPEKYPKLDFFRYFAGIFGDFFADPPKGLFLRPFWDFGPGGPGDSCEWSLGSQVLALSLVWFAGKLMIGNQYDWTTEGPCDGNEWKKHRVVPHVHPSRPLVYAYFNRSGSKGAFSLPGATWDHFRCMVEPSPGHILGARLRGRTATQRSKKGFEKVLGRVLGKGFSEGF